MIKIHQNRSLDCVSLGDIVLRADTGNVPLQRALTASFSAGGGEANVSYGLASCFRLRTRHLTAFVEDPIGRLLEFLFRAGGVDMDHAIWLPSDGAGRQVANSINFTSRGFGLLGPESTAYRGHNACLTLQPGNFNWDTHFGENGARWFHTGGVFTALSPSTAELAIEALREARARGVVTSYDINYRASIWNGAGGIDKALEVNSRILSHVDVVFGSVDHISELLGDRSPRGAKERDRKLKTDLAEELISKFPGIQAVALTTRDVRSANAHTWAGALYVDGTLYESVNRECDVFDRIGGGDSYASGVIYGLLNGRTPQECVELGAAHGALTQTTPGDLSMVSQDRVEALARGENTAKVVR